MSKESPKGTLGWYRCWCLPWRLGRCCWLWECHQRLIAGSLVEETTVPCPCPCKAKPGRLLVAIACWRLGLELWPTVLEARSLASATGKPPPHSHKQGPWSLPQPRKPCCSPHPTFDTREAPARGQKFQMVRGLVNVNVTPLTTISNQ